MQRHKQRHQAALERKILGPLVAWAVLVAILSGVTFHLQSTMVSEIEPIRALDLLYIDLSLVIEEATRLTIDTERMQQGMPWVEDMSGLR